MRDRIGSYDVLHELGRGGMGVVYLACDSRLDREVAIKTLPEHLAGDPSRLERFEREAKTLAGLNHPNVAGIYGVEEQDGARYLVLEFVDGETLADLLDRGPLPVDDAIEYAEQIAAGVEAAHEAGVIHRDLKPANIKISSGGTAKVLDFGLARFDEGGTGSSAGFDGSTVTRAQPQHSPTIEGAILGTAAYMSPEQARGRRVDKRTDIWSFGVVLYEMLTGVGPFHGETATDSIGAILHKDVELDRLPAGTPASLRRVLRRCLARDKKERYRDIGDVRIELRAEGEPEEIRSAVRTGSRVLVGVLGVALLAALVGLGVVLLGSPAATRPVLRVTLLPPADGRILSSGDLAGPAVVSPDGTKIAYVAATEGQPRGLWVHELDAAKPRELGGTEGALFPFWSPDGREIGYFSAASLWRYDLTSETVLRVCEVDQPRGGAWTDDGRIIFSRNFREALWVVDMDGGEIAPLTHLDEALHTSHRWPFIIPGTDRYLFSAVSARFGESDNNAIYIGRLDSDEPPTRVTASSFSAAYSHGNLLHVRDGVLLATPFDPGTGRLTGDPVAITRDVAADISTWHGQFSASGSGVIAYQRARGGGEASTARSGYAYASEGNRVSSYTYEGRLTTSYFVDTPMAGTALSPDGGTIAAAVLAQDQYFDIWLHPTLWSTDAGPKDPEAIRRAVMEPERRRLTFLPGAELAPVWSPDGDEIAFRWEGDDTRPPGIYRKHIRGGAEVLVHDNTGGLYYPTDWTPDGRYIISVSGTIAVADNNDLWALPVDGGEPIPLVTGPGTDRAGRVSPDGRWLAYTAIRHTRADVYVVPFAPGWAGGAPSGQWIVSDNQGRKPRWSPEGDELYYISAAGVLIARTVDTTGDDFSFSSPRALFQTEWDVGQTYDVMLDGGGGSNQFLFLESAENETAPVSLIVNWPQLLEDEGR